MIEPEIEQAPCPETDGPVFRDVRLSFRRGTEQVHQRAPVAVERLIRLIVPGFQGVERVYVEVLDAPHSIATSGSKRRDQRSNAQGTLAENVTEMLNMTRDMSTDCAKAFPKRSIAQHSAKSESF